MTSLLVCIGGLVPVLWGTAILAVRRLTVGRANLGDRNEKYVLAILIAPVVLGFALIPIAHCLPSHAPLAPFVELGQSHLVSEVSRTLQPSSQPLHFDWFWLAILGSYLVGLAINATSLTRTIIGLARIVANACRVGTHDQSYLLTTASVPPFAWGRKTIVLPTTLVSVLDTQDLDLVLSHERQHLFRRDPMFFALLSWVDAIFWFHPFVRAQTARCRLAAEIACDAAVIQEFPARRTPYARTILAAAKQFMGDRHLYAPAVFAGARDFRARLDEIIGKKAPKKITSIKAMYTVAAALCALVISGQYAWSEALSNEEKAFAWVWYPGSGAATKTSNVDTQHDVKLLHARILEEKKDASWANNAEATITRSLKSSLVDDGREPYFRVTCKTNLCEIVAIIEIEHKSNLAINSILDRQYKAQAEVLATNFKDNVSGVLTTDAVYGSPAKKMFSLLYVYRKAG